jgi:hypothetical protein
MPGGAAGAGAGALRAGAGVAVGEVVADLRASAAVPEPRPQITPRELAWLALASALIAAVMHWPLPLNLGSAVPKDLGDPLAQAWQPAWGGHALVSQPLEFFQANQFWPLPDTLAFSDALIGYAPFGIVGAGVEAAIVRYDLLFLLAYALAFAGAYLLARELGLGRGAAAVAAAAFAFAPFRLEQDGHLHVISSGGIPLALAAGLRGYRLARGGWVLTAWAIAAWQLTLGFTLGLPFAYLLAAIALLAALAWWRRGRPGLDHRVLAATVAGVIAFGATAAVLSRPYLRVRDAHPQAERSAADVEAFSGPPKALIVAPAENFVWGPATAPIRDTLSNIPEKTLFPGLAILLLATVGALGGPFPRGLRIGLVAAAASISILALGFREEGGLLWPYRVLYETVPGFDGIRAPGRLVTFSSLALALLAGAGAGRMLGPAGRGRGRRAAAAGASLLALVVAVEGAGLPFDPFDSRAQPRTPPAPAGFAAIAAPQLHLPALRPEDNRRYLLWSTDGFPEIVNGRSSVQPELTDELIAAARGFPDAASVERLRAAGVRSVVLHPQRTDETPWEGAESRSAAGLGLERYALGGVIVYEIRSESAGSSRLSARRERPRSR